MNEIAPKLYDRFSKITTWSRGSQRAPHKPLLLIYALSQVIHNPECNYIEFEKVKDVLKDLLIEFGPYRKTHHPEYPFWRLQNDGIWQLQNSDRIVAKASGDVSQRSLVKNNVSGGFTDEIFHCLKNNPDLAWKLINILLEDNFPESLHSEILQAVGLYEEENNKKNKRDPEFRNKILKAYEYKCAVCGFDVRIHNRTIGLEAAHIKWHQAGGPDIEENGIALCTLHHKLFDYGAFSLLSQGDFLQLNVSDSAHGTTGFKEWLMNFHKKRIAPPLHPSYYPNPQFVQWHVKEVFKGYGRY